MAVPTGNNIKLSDVLLEIYGSASTSGKSLLGAHTDAIGAFNGTYAVAGNTLLDFRGYTHTLGVVTSGLVLHLDAGDVASYPGTGTTWTDLSGAGKHFTISSASAWDSAGHFNMIDTVKMYRATNLTASTLGTIVFWIQTTDTQALFLHSSSTGGSYLSAFRVGNKEYHSGVGTPVYYQDTVDTPNVYDNIRDGEWHMVEFKNVNLSGWSYATFNGYSSYTFGTGTKIGKIMLYDRSITALESQQNFEADRARFPGIQPKATPSYIVTPISDYETRVVNDGGIVNDMGWLGDEFYQVSSTIYSNYYNNLHSAAGGFKAGTTAYGVNATNSATGYKDTGTYDVTYVSGDRPRFICTRTTDIALTCGYNSKAGNLYIIRCDLDYTFKPNYLMVRTTSGGYDAIEVGINSSGHLYAKATLNTAVTWTGATASDFVNCKIGIYKNATSYDIYLNGVKRLTGTCEDVAYRGFRTLNPVVPSYSFVGNLYSVMSILEDLTETQINTLTTPH